MPLNIDFFQILLHMLNFAILAGGLTFLLFKPIVNFLNERREHYESIESENAKKEEELNNMRSEYESKLADAKNEAAQLRIRSEKETADAARQYIEAAKQKADSIIRSAEEEAELRKEHILDSAQTEIGELVVSATQKLLSDTVTDERNSKLYDEFIRVAEKTVDEMRNPQ